MTTIKSKLFNTKSELTEAFETLKEWCKNNGIEHEIDTEIGYPVNWNSFSYCKIGVKSSNGNVVWCNFELPVCFWRSAKEEQNK